jgi:hypothetical protein
MAMVAARTAVGIEQEKTLTQLVSDWIDSVPLPQSFINLEKNEQV